MQRQQDVAFEDLAARQEAHIEAVRAARA